MTKIDFVMLWVDGNDKKWQKEKSRYDFSAKVYGSNGVQRYRDWDNLQYWFRGVEKFTPWVNKIYFVTWGHLPKWLNKNNPKLVIVNHKDYIPPKYLPTFSSNPIELNLNRIKNLSEHFVYFNDDIFILDYIKEEDFFKNGKPRDSYNEVNLDFSEEDNVFASILKNNFSVLNRRYNKRKTIFSHPFKYFNIKYGLKRNLQTLKTTLTKKDFVGITTTHLAQPFLKSYFEKAWEEEPDILNKTCLNKFRSKEDVNQYLIKQFQLLDGNFSPRDFKLGKYFQVKSDNSELINAIINKKYKMICINDSEKNIDFEECKKEINKALETVLSEKSSFEK